MSRPFRTPAYFDVDGAPGYTGALYRRAEDEPVRRPCADTAGCVLPRGHLGLCRVPREDCREEVRVP